MSFNTVFPRGKTALSTVVLIAYDEGTKCYVPCAVYADGTEYVGKQYPTLIDADEEVMRWFSDDAHEAA